MNAGVELRLARVKRGLSREEVCARTKISPAMLEAIEDAQFERLPALIYLRGFLRSYASEVGLPQAAIIERYLAEYESASRAFMAFDSEATVIETAVALRPPTAIAADEFEPETSAPASIEPMPATRLTHPVTRRAIGRIVALAAGLAAVIATFVAVRSLGSATQPVTLAAMPAATPPTAAKVVVAARALPGPATLHAGVTSEPTSAAASLSVAPDRPASVVYANAGEPILSGEWMLTNEVQTSSFKAFEGLELEYRLTLSQDGVIVTGRGHKWSENGREIPSARRTPISVAGTLYQNRLELSFTERGTRRTSAGRFVWQVSDDGALRGTFSSDAASSRGTSYARRTP
jgi:transcriptional regulator with XRE-family HTH domain